MLRWGALRAASRSAGLDYYAIAALIAAVWLALLASTHSYDARYLGIGSDEFRRVADAAIRVTALVAFVTFVGKLPLSRGFVAMALPIGLVSTLAGRYAARRVLHRLRRESHCLHRVLVVGTPIGGQPNSPRDSAARSTRAITSPAPGRRQLPTLPARIARRANAAAYLRCWRVPRPTLSRWRRRALVQPRCANSRGNSKALASTCWSRPR